MSKPQRRPVSQNGRTNEKRSHRIDWPTVKRALGEPGRVTA